MAIPGQEQINISNTANSDSLFTAFNKIQNNFTTLFSATSPFNTFAAGAGISARADAPNSTITFTNTGVTSLVAGTGVTLANSNGAYTISASGGNGSSGVTNVNVISSSLDVSGVPIISNGTIRIDMPTVPTGDAFAVGEYVAPTITVDRYGRITEIANSTGVGTVTSVSVAAGPGMVVYGGTVTDSGTITVTNTGVLSISTGTGLISSSPTGNGDVTIAIDPDYKKGIQSITVTSNSLVVSGGTISGEVDGVINVEIPDDFTITGNINLDDLSASQNVFVGNILTVTSSAHFGGNITSGNANLGNLAFANYISGNGALLSGLIGSNVSGQVSNALVSGTVYTNAQPNITSVGTLTSLQVTGNVTSGGNLLVTSNVSSGNANLGNLVTANYHAGVLTTGAQPNITSVGTLVSANVTGNISVGNVDVSSKVSSFDVTVANFLTISNTGDLVFNSVNNNTKGVILQAPNDVAGASGTYIVWALPNTVGAVGKFLTTDGAGTMDWKTVASSSAPATSTSLGTQGQVAFDATHIYVCIATNSWIRASAASW